MKVLSIIILSIMAIIFVLYFCDYFVYLKRVKYAENKVKLKGTNYKTSILWCALSIGWILISSSRYKEARICGDRNEAEWNLVVLIVWSICLFCYLFRLLFVRYIYLTDNSVIEFGNLKKMCQKSNYKYLISENGEILELYYKNNDIPLRYKIIEDKERLALILKENYEQYCSEN